MSNLIEMAKQQDGLIEKMGDALEKGDEEETYRLAALLTNRPSNLRPRAVKV